MAPTVIAIRHVAFEDLGVLGGLLAGRGARIEVVDAPIDHVDPARVARADLVVVLGGPIGVGDGEVFPFLRPEEEAIAGRLALGRPTLGICLGAQLMAHALGAEVAPTGGREIGYGPLSLTGSGRDSVLAPLEGVAVLHWHGDAFGIPAGARRLAGTPGFPNQAFDLTEAVLGLQFHLEVIPGRLESWLVGHSVELAAAGVDPADLRRQARGDGGTLAPLAHRVLGDWLDRVL